MSFVPAEHHKKSFTCFYCGVFSQMKWAPLAIQGTVNNFLDMAECQHCFEKSFWFDRHQGENSRQLIFPMTTSLPMPHPDMPESSRADYLEARAVMPHSAKAAAALLRLSLQKLCIYLGKSNNINKAIGQLVQDGLPEEVQMALDAVRIIGNESVHPGEIQDDELEEGVAKAFEMMNFIVQDRITKYARARELYEMLPEDKREAVADRDKG
ncbi:hypothetical protein CVH10_16620 [Halomonas sp. ND22Bw]|uniref:DUF4145 domain-containing protein n=1 Tax=Halomonas sp. ND22Bw TaxID=2054178 RepID=UPI000D0B3E39|nr:hypothetical protein CVH10_16620 [Halomonas sp. ND22Bw]